MSANDTTMKCSCNNSFCFCWTADKKNVQLGREEFLKKREKIEQICNNGGFQHPQRQRSDSSQQAKPNLACNETLPVSHF